MVVDRTKVILICYTPQIGLQWEAGVPASALLGRVIIASTNFKKARVSGLIRIILSILHGLLTQASEA